MRLKYHLPFIFFTSLILTLVFSTSHAANLELAIRIQDQQGQTVPDAVIIVKVNTLVNDLGLPGAEVKIDQYDKKFIPHVLAITPGTLVSFPNSDDTRHHVYSFSKVKPFELKLYRANDSSPIKFDQTGIIKLGCNIHDNMKAYIYISKEPFISVSDKNGQAAIHFPENLKLKNLVIWHPQLDQQQPLSFETSQLNFGALNLLTLPITWEPPQNPKTTSELESLLKSFSNETE
jgi:plastocyanin